jgi:ketosteroid isomerase-like protein
VVPPSNVEFARAATRDLASMFEHFDDEIVWANREVQALPIDIPGEVRGKPAVRRMVHAFVGTWDDYRFTVEELVDAGDAVLLMVSESGRGKGSGVPMEHRYCMPWTVRSQRVVRCDTYDDLAAACAALEVSPPP